MATIGLVRVENPLEYGIVISNEDGSIERFLEKPTWARSSPTRSIPASTCWSRGSSTGSLRTSRWTSRSDVFPALLEAGEPVHGSVAEGYW